MDGKPKTNMIPQRTTSEPKPRPDSYSELFPGGISNGLDPLYVGVKALCRLCDEVAMLRQTYEQSIAIPPEARCSRCNHPHFWHMGRHDACVDMECGCQQFTTIPQPQGATK